MPDASRPLPPAAIAALSNGKKIDAIKIVRQEWGMGLKDAKDTVEAYIETQPALAATMREANSNSQRGCVLGLLVLVLLAAVAYYFLQAR